MEQIKKIKKQFDRLDEIQKEIILLNNIAKKLVEGGKMDFSIRLHNPKRNMTTNAMSHWPHRRSFMTFIDDMEATVQEINQSEDLNDFTAVVGQKTALVFLAILQKEKQEEYEKVIQGLNKSGLNI